MLGLGASIPKIDVIADTVIPSSRSLSLDGAGDMATFTATAFPISDTGDNLSIAFWAKRTDNNDAAWVFGNTTTSSMKRINFGANGDTLELEGDQNGQTVSGAVTADTNWNFYAITMEGNSSGNVATTIIYENGVAVSSTNTNFGASSVPITINSIGASGGSGSNTNEFKGLLYNVGIWNTILDLNAVEHLTAYPSTALTSNAGGYKYSTNLIHYWRFEDVNDTVGDLELTLVADASFSSTIPS